ncbi:DUF2075 domain-containing protein [Paenibacillus pasadenensis]|uniref:DUF2075 domain-containing protein n=1 Tax=Paenibacillus pasadenensis TaxID=217090 RepID=UPI002040B837|nr:DUF2075 domain-containing protein [Paenibacillus pasadenensis]MCM3749232.1 DUF2075 domain-containing protein [Paenibacillus pasadenensis]
MIVYSSSVKQFKEDVAENLIAPNIETAYINKLGKRPAQSEWRAWNNSMQFMEKVVRNSKIADDCGVLIEYTIPSTSKRIDFVVAGHDQDSKKNFIIVELKQWETAEASAKEDIVRTFINGAPRETTHPSYQAWSYRQFMYDLNENVYTNEIKGHSVAFLHNYRSKNPEPLRSGQYQKVIAEAPLFFAEETRKLQEFLFKYVGKGDGVNLLYEIENGRIVPSKSLIDHIDGLFQGNSDFVLLDEQKVAYETIMSYAKKQDHKVTVIVKGGPGTGKSVISMNALGGLLKERLNTVFVAPNASFRNVMVEMLAKNRTLSKARTKNLFLGSGSFVNSRENEFDVLIIDEAHRLKGKGTYMYKGVNQVEDIIKSSKVNVFFIDEHQKIRPNDIGTVEEIKKHAKEKKSIIYEYELHAQFRCSGSDGYLNWIDDVLRIRDTGNFYGWDRDAFDFRILSSPHDVYSHIRQKQKEGFKARMTAGFAWAWSTEGNSNGQVEDVIIPEHNFFMPWNGKAIQSTWAIHPDGINQVGCVHTTQGLEFDYVGVIIGNDLKYDATNFRLFADYSEYKDTAGKKGLKSKPEELTKLISNIYKVLLTRGMKGCYVYCCNAELSQFLSQRLNLNGSVNF